MHANEMPKLRPIPIATKDESYVVRIWRWLTWIREWEVLEDWHYRLNDDTTILIPRRYVFDGASIPRPLWGLLSPVGLLLVPALLHDYAYEHNELISVSDQRGRAPYRRGARRGVWDRLFLRIAIDVNGFALIDVVAYVFVWAFGGRAWRKHRRNAAVMAAGAQMKEQGAV